jgi:hypothetical protein
MYKKVQCEEKNRKEIGNRMSFLLKEGVENQINQAFTDQGSGK